MWNDLPYALVNSILSDIVPLTKYLSEGEDAEEEEEEEEERQFKTCLTRGATHSYTFAVSPPSLCLLFFCPYIVNMIEYNE